MVRVPLVRLRLTSLRVVAVPNPLQGVMYYTELYIHMTSCITHMTGFVANTMLL